MEEFLPGDGRMGWGVVGILTVVVGDYNRNCKPACDDAVEICRNILFVGRASIFFNRPHYDATSIQAIPSTLCRKQSNANLVIVWRFRIEKERKREREEGERKMYKEET